ncbi:MAG TPA: thiamine phosphate synthase [Polyangiaceae bacterium]
MKLTGLYAIVDTAALAKAQRDPIAFARALLVAKPAALQLRAKNDSARSALALALVLAPLCREAGVPFVVNDRVDLALAAGADVVHLGQDDLDLRSARAIAPKLAFGVSTHSPDQLARALEAKPDYVAYGPIFATSSKANPDPVVGLEGLSRARSIVNKSKAPDTPLVAIGGISAENAAQVASFADAAAMIGALVVPDVAGHARALHRSLGGRS